MGHENGINRRRFLAGSVALGGGVALGRIGFPVAGAHAETSLPKGVAGTQAAAPAFAINPQPWVEPLEGVEVNPWVVIAPDNRIMIRVNQAEIGQGVFTSNPMMVCEELEGEWEKVTAVYADVNRHFREKKLFVRFATGSSSSVRSYREVYQHAGADARERLRTAASRSWGVPLDEVTAAKGILTHGPSGRTVTFSDVAAAAATIKLESSPAIKKPQQYSNTIGRPVRMLDTEIKTYGLAVFGVDVRLEGMVYAAFKQPPAYGAKLKSYDFAGIKAMPGVISAVPVDIKGLKDVPDASGIAVVANSWWRAAKALEHMPIEWEESPTKAVGTASIAQTYVEKMDEPGQLLLDRGNVEEIFAQAAKTLEATYSAPHIAHAPMEPMNCTARVSADRVDLWVSTQCPDDAAEVAAKVSGLPVEKVFVHQTFIGGGFGRRGYQDYVAQAVAIAKQIPDRPVKLLWSREEDITHDNAYHPSGAAKLKSALDSHGMPTAWLIRKVGDVYKTPEEMGPKKLLIDPRNIRSLDLISYNIPGMRVESHDLRSPFPTGDLRGTGTLWNAFIVESFIDECAHAAGQDPYRYRRALLEAAPDDAFDVNTKKQWLEVLDRAAKSSGWGAPLPKGTARGIAICDRRDRLRGGKSRGNTPAAVVATVSVSKSGTLTVERVDIALDGGHALMNPEAVIRQLRGQVAWSMGLAMHQEVIFENSRVTQSNFNDYPMVTMAEYPKQVNIELIKSDHWIYGIGEELSPHAIPAICNAIFAATGKRIRSLPLKNHDLSWA